VADNFFSNTFRALKYYNFRLFFAGQFISLTGTWMQTVAQSWLVYRLTGSVVLLGLISFAGQIPVFLLAPFGGVIADKYNRQRILVITQTVSMLTAFVLAILTLTQTIEVWHLFVLAVCFGLANAFDIPTRQAFVADMVGREDLLNAIALNSTMFNGARIVGPAIAGILVAVVGEGWCFFVNATSYIAVIAGILLMKITPVVREVKGSTLSNIAEGFRFVAQNPPVRSLLLLLGLVSLMGMPYAVLMPIFADKILGGGSQTLGLLMGASGTGALTAALLLASRKSFRAGQMGFVCFGGFGRESDFVLFFKQFLSFAAFYVADWFFDDDADEFVEHADSGDGSRRIAWARDERLFDDVYGNGSARRVDGGQSGGNFRRTEHRRFGRLGLHFGFNPFSFPVFQAPICRTQNDFGNADDGGTTCLESEFSRTYFDR
jgi:MFS family permease